MCNKFFFYSCLKPGGLTLEYDVSIQQDGARPHTAEGTVEVEASCEKQSLFMWESQAQERSAKQ